MDLIHPARRSHCGVRGGGAGRLLDVGGTTLDTAVRIVVILFVGLYLAASPGRYRDGLVRLLPQDRRERARQVLDETGDVLWRWVMGRIIPMVSNGLFNNIGLLIIGVPLPLVLGTIAGVLNSVPNIGPIVAAIPAILIALVRGPLTAVYVAGTLGLLLATPIAAALLVLAKMLYVEDVLGEPVEIQGKRV